MFLIDRLEERGGTEAHLLDLVRGLTARGLQVTVSSLIDGRFSAEFTKIHGVRYFCLGARRLLGYMGASALIAIARYIRSERVDILQSFHTGSDLLAPLAARLSSSHVSVISSRRDMGFTKSSRHILFQRLLNHWNDLILANSQGVKFSIMNREHVPPERIRVIYNGIHPQTPNVTSTGKLELRKSFGLPPDSCLIGSVGNVRPVKGFNSLIHAAFHLLHFRNDVSFAIAGGGDHSELKELISAFHLKERFFLLGPIRNVADFLYSLDIYVQPSLSEGFSNSVLEAMSCGLPIAVSSAGGNKEIITNSLNGLTFTPGNIHEMIACLLFFIKNKQIATIMGQLAQDTINKSYLFSRMIEAYYSIYINMANNHACANETEA